eukprot:GHVL01023699.1.p1 GENE.GHVL01023699.1~~GHVL01023699.1.p1  ORF type:complete len:777 (+),score=104.03 GHVL01023699.1:146-2476(+)
MTTQTTWNKRYSRIKVVGRGSFGQAILVKDLSRSHNKQYVIKVINIARMNSKQKSEALNEAHLLSKLKHPYIISCKESFVDAGQLCIVMDYADGGDLYTKIHEQQKCLNSQKYFSEGLILRWFTQICLAIKHSHDRRILHRDLKTQNIFISGSNPGRVKVGDFGIAKVLEHTQDVARTAIGTPYYLSPEMCQEKPYDFKSDIWSLGCVLYEMTTLKHAFDAHSMKGLIIKILRGTYPPIPSNFSSDLCNLIKDMLTKDPEKRPTVDLILQRSFIQRQIRLLLSEEEGKSTKNKVVPETPSPSTTESSPTIVTKNSNEQGPKQTPRAPIPVGKQTPRSSPEEVKQTPRKSTGEIVEERLLKCGFPSPLPALGCVNGHKLPPTSNVPRSNSAVGVETENNVNQNSSESKVTQIRRHSSSVIQEYQERMALALQIKQKVLADRISPAYSPRNRDQSTPRGCESEARRHSSNLKSQNKLLEQGHLKDLEVARVQYAQERRRVEEMQRKCMQEENIRPVEKQPLRDNKELKPWKESQSPAHDVFTQQDKKTQNQGSHQLTNLSKNPEVKKDTQNSLSYSASPLMAPVKCAEAESIVKSSETNIPRFSSPRKATQNTPPSGQRVSPIPNRQSPKSPYASPIVKRASTPRGNVPAPKAVTPRDASSTPRVASSIPRIDSPTQRAASPTQRAAFPTQRAASPSQRRSSIPQRVSSIPRRILPMPPASATPQLSANNQELNRINISQPDDNFLEQHESSISTIDQSSSSFFPEKITASKIRPSDE